MMEERKKNKSFRHFLILFLLFVIAAVVICTHVKVNKMYKMHKKMMYNHGKFMNDMKKGERYTDKEYSKGKNEARKIGEEVKNTIRTERSRTVDREGFFTEAKHNEDAKEFVVEVKLPRNFTRDDMEVTLKGGILEIFLKKETTRETENFEGTNFSSYSRSFVLPKTSATIKDVKEVQDGNKINIIVPIK